MADERGKRTLTDADVEAIAEALRGQFLESLYRDIGRGVFGIVWKVLITALIGIAAYGAYHFKD